MISNTVTTAVNQASHVRITVNARVDPTPPSPVLEEAWFQGSGCASTGGVQPALMVVLALGGLWGLRRRRA